MKKYFIGFASFVIVSLGVLKLFYWESFRLTDRILPTLAVGLILITLLVSLNRKNSKNKLDS
jgi:hypothetical protein